MGQPNPQAGYETSPSPLNLRDTQEKKVRALQEENHATTRACNPAIKARRQERYGEEVSRRAWRLFLIASLKKVLICSSLPSHSAASE